MSDSESNEILKPGQKRAPRLPGNKRDFGKLPATMRSAKGWQSNLVEAESEEPPQGMPPSKGPLLKPEVMHPKDRAIMKRLAAHKKGHS
jgi:hypothetical protein